VNPHAQNFRNHRAATGAPLRCASGVDAQHCATGAFSLVRGELHELAPGRIRNTLINGVVPVRWHVGNVQVFKNDQTKAVDRFTAFLMCKVGAVVGRPLVGVVERPYRLAPLWAALSKASVTVPAR